MSMRILVAPLHWGLGHATRCIPIIRDLLRCGCQVHIAADGRALSLLRDEFPHLPYTELQGYDIRYPATTHRWFSYLPYLSYKLSVICMAFAMLCQTPRILWRIRKEYEQTQYIVQQNNIDLIISDNRYGCRSSKTRNIFICHQIFLQVPPPFGWLMPIIARLHRLFIDRFDECWIPDYDKLSCALSGDLSRYKSLPKKYKFIGILSRFSAEQKLVFDGQTLKTFQPLTAIGNTNSSTTNLDIPSNITQPPNLAQSSNTVQPSARSAAEVGASANPLTLLLLLSGPEPQRTSFEQLILSQIFNYAGKALIVRGITEGSQEIKQYANTPNIQVVDHLNAQKLKEQLLAADFVVARAGYSTIMDLAALGKKALLVPTPGQTEQIYLGNYLAKKGLFDSVNEGQLNLIDYLGEIKIDLIVK